jgi:hypothetical protein
VVPEVSADDARRRSDEAVRRLRDESARRVAHAGRGAGISRCALGALLSLSLLATLGARPSEPPPDGASAVAPAAEDRAVTRVRDRREMSLTPEERPQQEWKARRVCKCGEGCMNDWRRTGS